MKAANLKKYLNKSKPTLRASAKLYFNRFIRLRDTDDNGYGTCISSGQTLMYGTENCQAGHYFSGGEYPVLEFNEDNVNLQGKSDNYYKSGNQLPYRRRLIDKIGEDRVKDLELMAARSKRQATKRDKFFFIEVIETYKEKCKILRKDKMF